MTTFWARTDSNSANNPALNLTTDPALEITFVASGTDGDWLLEQPVDGGIDPDTQVEIDGVSYDFTFELSATLPTLKKDGAQQIPDQYEGAIVYTITVHDYPSAGETTRLTFMPDEDATQAEMDSFGSGGADLQNLDVMPDPGTICFAQGTHILTPDGEVKVEDLNEGDQVMTLDHGPQKILWISTTELNWPGDCEKSLPIKIAAGAIGPNLPKRDLVVSPQHKLLLSVSHLIGLEQGEVLAPAKGLLSLPGIRRMQGKKSVIYYHIMLENHEILFSEGLATESFFPGEMALKMLTPSQRRDVLQRMRGLNCGDAVMDQPTARPCLTCSQTRLVVEDARQKAVSLAPNSIFFDELIAA
ncbi:Hint domain-containing protein [Aliiroseovarius sp. KMU-50]|uniref:Hint domain-containing protein n=1 Tax=Aliiroseovarius salicola TaxID=3009082 RepID=A0ABT4W0F1_9RHOB|nr:Hint domain-containing protein [Aliiroseovarius sp. KMU-50]MDA5093986.1 Hint domain-containing protein [Aliiroseovarius sp. KMU-50]